MNDSKVNRKLNSIGKEKFVLYYELFNKYACNLISKEKAIQILVEKNVSNKNGAHIRLGNAKLIFVNNKQNEALKIICNSKRISQPIRNLALNILKND